MLMVVFCHHHARMLNVVMMMMLLCGGMLCEIRDWTHFLARHFSILFSAQSEI